MTNKKQARRKITRKNKQTPLKNIHSVEDLLTRDDINDMLRDLDKNRIEITDLIIIWQNKDEEIIYDITPNTKLSLAILMLESTKIDLLRDE